MLPRLALTSTFMLYPHPPRVTVASDGVCTTMSILNYLFYWWFAEQQKGKFKYTKFEKSLSVSAVESRC